MQILRTPAERFADIPDYPFAENWFETDLGDGLSARMHYIDEGPRDAPPCCCSTANRAGRFSIAR